MSKFQTNNFRRSQDGAVAIEFAIVSLLFISFVLGIFEFSRLLWVKQAVTDVAARAARCATAGDANSATACTNNPEINDFAIAEAASMGILLTRNDVTVNQGVQCNGYRANLVDITFDFISPVADLIPGLMKEISVQACYPVPA